jgi:hypothetical protein
MTENGRVMMQIFESQNITARRKYEWLIKVELS